MADSDDDEKVGYGRPPKGNQFKKGQSGNRKGRPKGSHSMLSAMQAELDSAIKINIGGELKKVTKRQAIAMALVHVGMKGNARAVAEIIKMEERHLSKSPAKSITRFTLSLGESPKPAWLPGKVDSDGDDPTLA